MLPASYTAVHRYDGAIIQRQRCDEPEPCALRQRDLLRAAETDTPAPLSFGLVAAFTVGGVVLALTTVVLVVAPPAESTDSATAAAASLSGRSTITTASCSPNAK